MRKFYTAIAMLFVATATALAQTPLSSALMAEKQVNTSLNRQRTAKAELKLVDNGNAAAMRRTPAKTETLPTVDDVIVEQPNGTLYQTYRSCMSYYPDVLGTGVQEGEMDGLVCEIVVSNDGKKIYMRNPFVNLDSKTWLVGDMDAEGNVEFKFPQIIYRVADASGESLGYAWKMKKEAAEGGTAVKKDEESQVMKFKWSNQSLVQVNDDEVLGMGNEEAGWFGYGTYKASYFKFGDVAMEPDRPGMAEEWRFSYTSAIENSAKQDQVRVIVEGNYIWVGDIYKKDYWILGAINGNKAVFPMQYMGADAGTYKYMWPIELRSEGGKTMAYAIDNITFDYDAAAKKLSSEYVLAVNVGRNKTQIVEGYMSPVIESVDYVVGTPAKPVIDYIMPFNSDKQQPNLGGVVYVLSNLTTDGKELNNKNIYYNIYLDDELLTFDKENYPYIDNEMTDLPYGYTDKFYNPIYQYYGDDLYTNSKDGITYQNVYLKKNFNKVGVKAVYVDGTTRYESEIMEYVVTGIDNAGIDEGTEVKGVSYSDLSGRTVSAPVHGIYLMTMKLANGQSKTVKVIR